MKIITIGIYKDGGTKVIETDQGKYWMPAPLGKTKMFSSRLFKGDGYFQDKAVEVTDPYEIFELMHELATAADRFFYIQRVCK